MENQNIIKTLYIDEIRNRFDELDKRYFKAVYKTNVLEYDGVPVDELNWGNIISYTKMFSAKTPEHAKQISSTLFNLSNSSFYPLKRNLMKVKHELLEIKEIKIPSFSNKKFKHVNQFVNNDIMCWKMNLQKHTTNSPSLPESFLGFNTCSVYRKMPHFNSDKKTVKFLYHPWHGAGDGFRDWYEVSSESSFWNLLEEQFNSKFQTEEEKFSNTEYTNLDSDEQEVYKKIKQLDFLDNQNCYDNDDDIMTRHQGHFCIHYGQLYFIENENPFYSGIRFHYKSKREEQVRLEEELKDAKRKVESLENKLNLLNSKVI